MKHIEEARERFKDTVDTTTNTKTDQFRRCVRYLKRWNDVCIPREMDSKPSGLAWALLAAKHLQVSHQVDGKPDDRKALYYLARQLADTPGRIVARKPSPEYEDILQSLSNSDMDELKGRLNDLAEVLSFADNHKDPVDACKMLRGVFGNDYPVPSLEDTGKGTKAPAIITSSPSAA
jgi:hypothetical protein